MGVRGGGYGTFGCFIGNSGPNLGPFKTTLERLNPTFHNTYTILNDNSDGDAIFSRCIKNDIKP